MVSWSLAFIQFVERSNVRPLCDGGGDSSVAGIRDYLLKEIAPLQKRESEE